MGQIHTNYIIFRNVEIFKKQKSEINFFPKEKKESDTIFENISYQNGIVKINYIFDNMCQSEQGTMVVSYLYYALFHVHGWRWGKYLTLYVVCGIHW